MAHPCAWSQTRGLYDNREEDEVAGLVGLIGQRSYSGLAPQLCLPVDVEATADLAPGWPSTATRSAHSFSCAVNMQLTNVPLAHDGPAAAGPYFVVWYVRGARMECRGVHGRGSRAWLAICRAIPGGCPRPGCDLIRGGFATRAEARQAYLRESHEHNCPPGCAEWRW